MPSPVAHSLAGLAVGAVAWGPRGLFGDWRRAAACVVAANTADLDFIPGLLIGDAGAFHHGVSHSLGMTLLFAAVAAALAAKGERSRWFLIAALAYGSHVLLDGFSRDPRPPSGVPALWPLSARTWISPLALFDEIRRADSAASFLPSLFSRHNLMAVAREVAVMGPVTLLAMSFKR